MYPLLALVFAIAVATTPDAQDANHPPFPPPDERWVELNTWDSHPIDRWTEINLWDSHPEGWDKVYAIPIGDPFEFAEATLEEGVATRMGNGTSDVERWRELVASQFPPEQVENALCVIRSESGGEPHIRNLAGSNARGLGQIMTTIWGPYFGWSHEDFYDPSLNVYAMARIWEMSGWQPWSGRTRRNCGL